MTSTTPTPTSTSDVPAPAPASWDFRNDGIETYTLEEVDDHLERSLGYSVMDTELKTALSTSKDASKDSYTDSDLEVLDGWRTDGKLTEAELEVDDYKKQTKDAVVTVGDAYTDKTYTVSSYANKLEGDGQDIDERGLLEVLNAGRSDSESDWTFTSAFTEKEALERLGEVDVLDDTEINQIRMEAKDAASDDGNKSRVKYKGDRKTFNVGTLAASAEKALREAGYTGEYANIDESGLASIFSAKSLDDKVFDKTIKSKFDTGLDDGVLDIFEIQEMQKSAKEKGTAKDSKLIDKDAQWDYDTTAGVDTYNATQFAKAVRMATGLEVDKTSKAYNAIKADRITDTELRALDKDKNGYLSETELATITTKALRYSGDDKTSYTQQAFLDAIQEKTGRTLTAADLDEYFRGGLATQAIGGLTDKEILDSTLDENDDGILTLQELPTPAPKVLQLSGGSASQGTTGSSFTPFNYKTASSLNQLLASLETAWDLPAGVEINEGKLKRALGLRKNASLQNIKDRIDRDIDLDSTNGLSKTELQALKTAYNGSSQQSKQGTAFRSEGKGHGLPKPKLWLDW